MATYTPNDPPFLSNAMTSGAARGMLERQIGLGSEEAVAAAYHEGSGGQFTYQTEHEAMIVSFSGGPRIMVTVSVTGPYVFAMEYGSEFFPKSYVSRGALRNLVGD